MHFLLNMFYVGTCYQKKNQVQFLSLHFGAILVPKQYQQIALYVNYIAQAAYIIFVTSLGLNNTSKVSRSFTKVRLVNNTNYFDLQSGVEIPAHLVEVVDGYSGAEGLVHAVGGLVPAVLHAGLVEPQAAWGEGRWL